MRNALASAAIGAVVGVAIAAAAAASGISMFAGAPGKRIAHATIELNPIGGECYITTSPQTLELYKKELVEWTVVDRCGVTVNNEVEIVFDNPEILDPACTKKHKKTVKCGTNSQKPPAVGLYKYKVMAPGAQTEDPVLEIVQ